MSLKMKHGFMVETFMISLVSLVFINAITGASINSTTTSAPTTNANSTTNTTTAPTTPGNDDTEDDRIKKLSSLIVVIGFVPGLIFAYLFCSHFPPWFQNKLNNS